MLPGAQPDWTGLADLAGVSPSSTASNADEAKLDETSSTTSLAPVGPAGGQSRLRSSKDPEHCVEIGRSFEEKRVTKEYRAIVVGEIDATAIANRQTSMKIDRIISNVTRYVSSTTNATTTTTSSPTLSFMICSDVDGKRSETDVEVLGRTPCNVNGVLTGLKLFEDGTQAPASNPLLESFGDTHSRRRSVLGL